MTEPEIRITGGCQCGAVRYALHAEPPGAAICHCRMCQKAFGSPFAAVFSVPRTTLEITRGVISVFASSAKVQRGFCSICGTPLTISFMPSENINIAIASLDEPHRVQPAAQYGVESRLSWTDDIAALPAYTTDESFADYLAVYDEIKATNHQHPDHDTAEWPPGERSR
jgi:hypothetical protein